MCVILGCMGLRGPKSTITQDVCDQILKFLSDGSCPFLAVAAERAGVNRNRAKDWISAAERGETTNEIMHRFAKDVRRIRAEWVARTTRDLQTCADKDAYQSSRHKAWLLERLDRDLFDTTVRYLPKHQQPVQSQTDHTLEPQDLTKVLNDLERPDTHETH